MFSLLKVREDLALLDLPASQVHPSQRDGMVRGIDKHSDTEKVAHHSADNYLLERLCFSEYE